MKTSWLKKLLLSGMLVGMWLPDVITCRVPIPDFLLEDHVIIVDDFEVDDCCDHDWDFDFWWDEWW
jgi:hypothetical protein